MNGASDAPPSAFDHYYCANCNVTFREPFPTYYDVTPCPSCGSQARNVGLAAGGPAPLL